jgi:hypothetical protein
MTYGELRLRGDSMGPLVESLTGGKIRGEDGAHLDPDLRASAYPRRPGWRPIFGQDGAAQAHLQNAGVGEGDLFLFFGWFRRVERAGSSYRFVRGAPDLHVLFGWLQIERVLALDGTSPSPPVWAAYHPHCHRDAEGQNTIYLARERLVLEDESLEIAGGGIFTRYQESLRLTAPGCTRSVWRLPDWFHPREGRVPLTYHRNTERWSMEDEHTILRSVPRGQEFVLDTDEYPEAVEWVRSIVEREHRSGA